jgi:hypothetical protein
VPYSTADHAFSVGTENEKPKPGTRWPGRILVLSKLAHDEMSKIKNTEENFIINYFLLLTPSNYGRFKETF